METAGNDKIHELVDFQITVYRVSRAVEIVPGVKKQCAPMKTARNDKIHGWS